MSGKRGGHGRHAKAAGGASSSGAPKVPQFKPVDATSRAPGLKSLAMKGKHHNKPEETTSTEQTESTTAVPMRQGRLKPAPALLAMAAAKEASAAKTPTSTPTTPSTEANTTATKSTAPGITSNGNSTSTEASASGSAAPASITPATSITAAKTTTSVRPPPPVPKRAPPAPPKSTTISTPAPAAPSSHAPSITPDTASSAMEVDNGEGTPSNPKKRKAPEAMLEEFNSAEANKRRTPAEAPLQAWRTHISEVDPSSMSLIEIDLEIVSIKGAILSLKETIAKTELSSRS